MTGTHPSGTVPQHPVVNAGRLWAGGLATALVAALIAVVGILLTRGLFGVPILAPQGAGTWGDASTFWYAFGAAALSLAATGLMHMLLLSTPKPMRFFGWVAGLVTLAAMLAPFVTDAGFASRFCTALLNLVIGVAIASLVAGTAHVAVRPIPPAVRVRPRPYP